MVINFTDFQIPDGAYLFLSKGNSFVPAVSASKHDIVFDTNEFLRKLSWRTFFNTTGQNNCHDTSGGGRISYKLKLNSNKWPTLSNKLLDNFSTKMKDFVNSLGITKINKYKNLTFLEKKGLLWCLEMKNKNKIHFSQADKGGATIIMDPLVVNQTIKGDLDNGCRYVKLLGDPRLEIENNLVAICESNLTTNGLNESEMFHVTGKTDKGKSHHPLFKSGKPNPFPLYKLHSISKDDILNKVIPPHRLVTSMKYGPTKRSALFIDSILTPVSIIYCGKEYLKDTTDFLNKLFLIEDKLCRPGVQLFTLDVKALYPSINPTLVPLAIESALRIITDFSDQRIQAIVDIVSFNITNAVTHYRGEWFKSVKGLPTGGSDSVCIANIYMKWVLIQFFAKHPVYKSLVISSFRFIDDLFGGWLGTLRQFTQFVHCFNTFGSNFGISFDKQEFGDTVNFLDVLVSNATGAIVTDIYCKPTDAHRYLHRSSFHPQHTFRGIPFSQMRRAVVICSTTYLRDIAINNMINYFLECGYKRELLDEASSKARSLVRNDLLSKPGNIITDTGSHDKPLCFVLTHSVDVPKIKKFVQSFLDDIEFLTGTRKIIFSQKRNKNTGTLLFNKYGFAQLNTHLLSQKCGAKHCFSCALKFDNNDPINLLDNFVVTPSIHVNCKSSSIIYVAICKVCSDFYFGQTMTEEHIRMNGHRDKFNIEKFDKSALSMHIYTDHPDNTEHDLLNFNVAILESTNAINLNRRESFYIWSTEGDIRHLNRYKLVK